MENKYDPHCSIVAIEGSLNLRDLGGMPIRDGKVFPYKRFLRSGSLTECPPDILDHLKDYGVTTVIDLRSKAEVAHYGNPAIDDYPFAFNEISIRRSGPAMLAVDVCLNGIKLPTYWSDGIIISTSSGSTAYSLSVGGPIVFPDAKVFVMSPIAPHNLNVRPLVIPETSEITMTVQTRDGHFEFAADNRTADVPENTAVTVRMAQFSLKRIRLKNSNFIQALSDKLYWGEDVRNII